MKKIIDINEYKAGQEFEKDFEEFVPLWAEYWNRKKPEIVIVSQMLTITRLLQFALKADAKFGILDKKCKQIIKTELEKIIKLLD